MDAVDEESVVNLKQEVQRLRLAAQQEQLSSQKRIERNTFYTMIAVASHAGVGLLQIAPSAGDLVAPALLGAVWWWLQ